METAALSPKVALVGGGTLAKALLEALERQGVLGSVLGVADPDEAAPGVLRARERGLSTTGDFHSLYGLPGLEAIIEVTGRDEVLEELLLTRPPEVAVIDHTRARLIAAGALGLAEAALGGASPRGLNLFVRQVLDAIGDGLAILNRDLEVVEFNEAMRRMVDGKWHRCWRGGERPCPECRVRETFETGEPQQAMIQAPDGRWIELRTYPVRDERGTAGLVIEHARDVTEREQALEALRESEERYRQLVENSPDCIKLLDLEGRYLTINAAGLAAMGRSSLEEVLGLAYAEDFDPADRPAVRQAIERAAAGEMVSLEARSSPELPRRIIWMLTVAALRGAEGEVRRLLVIARDETERKQAEMALAESEEKYRSLVEQSLMGVYLIQDGLFRFVNPRLAEIFGYRREELVGRLGPMDLVAPPDRALVAENIRRRIAGEVASIHYSFRGLKKRGEVFDVEVLGSRTMWHGRPAVHGSLMNITGRKQAVDALAESEERYRVLVENSPDCIKLLDRQGRYLSINQAGVKALGRPLEAILGTRYSEDFDPADRAAIEQAIERAVAGAVASAEGRSPPGAPRPITWMVTLVPLKSPQGEVGRLLGVSRDVTGLRQAERTMRQANEELARLSRLKDEFLSMASHELKTPVTSIKLFCELAQRRPDKIAARLPEVLATINRQADHLVSLVNDLLDVSRLDLGRVRLELEPCDLRDLLDEVCALSRELYASHPLDCQRPEEPVMVRADSSRLIQVLQNLIDNATKYSPAGSPVEVSVEASAGRVIIAVRDRGAGISAEDLPHIFERFYKSRGQQAVVSGLGLGLYISRELVLRHGGRLWAASRVGEGSTFFVGLPLLSQGPPVKW